MKAKKILVSTVAAVCLFGTVTAFAASTGMDGGYAYLNASYSGGMRMCDAGTVRDNNNHYASLYVCSNYDDGSTSDYWSGIIQGNPSETSGWDYAADYDSIHRLYSSRTSGSYDTARLSAN